MKTTNVKDIFATRANTKNTELPSSKAVRPAQGRRKAERAHGFKHNNAARQLAMPKQRVWRQTLIKD
jgi:hypothetical protein